MGDWWISTGDTCQNIRTWLSHLQIQEKRMLNFSCLRNNFWWIMRNNGKETGGEIFLYEKDISLTTDTIDHSISGILSQEEHPIMNLSRRLTNTEFNYSNIQKEALAFAWTTTRVRQFLIGKTFLWKAIIGY